MPFFVVLSIYTIQSAPLDQGHELQKLHEALKQFIVRGQMVIELIPPLSFIIARCAESWVSPINVVSQGAWFALLMGSSCQLRALFSRRCIFLLALSVGCFSVNLSTKPDHPFGTSNNVAECLLALAFSYFFYLQDVPADLKSIESIFGALEILPVLAFMLGCNTLDAGFCYVFVFIHRCYDIFVRIADQRRSMVCQQPITLHSEGLMCFP